VRLFVAVDLDEAVRRAAGRLARTLRERLEQAGSYSVSWVASDNLHLTLQFLGEVDDRAGAAVTSAMATPFAQPPFDLELAGVGTFPPGGPARVLWFGISAGAAALDQLSTEVDARLRPLGFPREDRGFRAHLTVARFRTPAPPRVRDLTTLTSAGPIGRCQVQHVTLYQSHLSPKGATYTPLTRAVLGGSRT
jgi:2'-5' RNA ligase